MPNQSDCLNLYHMTHFLPDFNDTSSPRPVGGSQPNSVYGFSLGFIYSQRREFSISGLFAEIFHFQLMATAFLYPPTCSIDTSAQDCCFHICECSWRTMVLCVIGRRLLSLSFQVNRLCFL